jgi:hypothetical protein
VVSKDEIFKMLTKEFKEVDLRRYYLRLREKSYTTDVTVRYPEINKFLG